VEKIANAGCRCRFCRRSCGPAGFTTRNGGEYGPPITAYVGQRGQASIRAIFLVVRNKRDAFRRNPVYGRERGLQEPNQTENFWHVPSESFRLKNDMRKPLRTRRNVSFRLFSPEPDSQLWQSYRSQMSDLGGARWGSWTHPPLNGILRFPLGPVQELRQRVISTR
jgi:hypothetical protein